MRAHRQAYLPALLAALAVPSAVPAQSDARMDVVVANRHIWRGVNRATAWVGQVQGSGSLRVGPGALGAGVSELREMFEAAAGNVTEVGQDRRGLGERNWWAEYRFPVGPVSIGGGAVHYTYHGAANLRGRGPENNTSELFLAAELTRTDLSPMLAAFWDVEAARGLYLEASGRAPLLGWPWPPEVFIYLDGAFGFSAGLDPNPGRRGELSYYADAGFTHAQLGLAVDVKRTSHVALGGGFRFTRPFDASARGGADGRDRSLFLTLWAGATLGSGLPKR